MSLFSSVVKKIIVKNGLLSKAQRSSKALTLLDNRVNYLSTTSISMAKKRRRGEEETRLSIRSLFSEKDHSKDSFIATIEVFKERDKHLRGHVEFIYAALKYMEEYGVQKDLEVYKNLVDVMPKDKMIPRNLFQEEFMHYPKQQQCAIDVLEKMEENGVLPDTEMEMILVNTFGKRSHPVRKFGRMMYWMTKFKNASPWALPHTVPLDALELAKMAVARMCTVDPISVITVFETNIVEDAIDDTWIVSGQSPIQEKLIEQHPIDQSIKVEGPFRIFLRDQCVGYFILRAEATPPPPAPKKQDDDDVSNLKFWFTGQLEEEEEKEISKPRTVHEQDDGTILAIGATGTSSRDSLLSWIRLLQERNPKLAEIPVLFTQASPIGTVMTVDTEHETENSIDPKS